VAKAWGKTPSEWDALDTFDQAEMIAHTDTENKMTAYEQEQAERDRKKS
jgi:hypothetical protein